MNGLYLIIRQQLDILGKHMIPINKAKEQNSFSPRHFWLGDGRDVLCTQGLDEAHSAYLKNVSFMHPGPALYVRDLASFPADPASGA